MLHADEEDAVRQSDGERLPGNQVQKKAQLVHWTDESDFQANSWLAGYVI